ncbi:MAG: hypothetical protein JSU63_18200 [Phycisphaerales bacterium]|nr:MAG: hypothetical protein JSU63_18200 [Phycisphaerales bacterium]
MAGLICAGLQADDWLADYRLFVRDRWRGIDLFAPVECGTLTVAFDSCVQYTLLTNEQGAVLLLVALTPGQIAIINE